MFKDCIEFYVNGKPYKVSSKEVFYSVSDYLRDVLCLKGTKVVCGEGDCGACTVLLGRMEDGKFNYYPVNSCILFVYQINNCHVVTIEGLKYGEDLNPIQKAVVENHGTQCGFCTPGVVTTMYSMFDKASDDKKPTESDIEKALTGNLCRCTGYKPIIKSGMAVSPCAIKKLSALYPESDFYKQEDERIEGIDISVENRRYIEPYSFEKAVEFKHQYNGAKLLSGGTDVHILHNKRGYEPEITLNLAHIKELKTINMAEDYVCIGSTVTISTIEKQLEKLYPEFCKLLENYASPQVKNIATIVGNIANGSPAGDSIPFLMAMNAEIEIVSLNSTRFVNINNFYKGYKLFELNSDEIIKGIRLPYLKPNEILKLYKLSKRKHLDISTFTAAFKIAVENDLIISASVAYGGVGPTVQKMVKTEGFLTGKKMMGETFVLAGKVAESEIKPISDVRGSDEHKIRLAKNILKKFYSDVLENNGGSPCLQ